MGTSIVSRDLDRLIEVEFQQLRMLTNRRRFLVERSLRGPVDLETMDALSALLHSTYTAVERIMLHVLARQSEVDLVHRDSAMWHARLLNVMATASTQRPAILSALLHSRLKEYLGFRHVFRHAYLHELQWEKMRGLA